MFPQTSRWESVAAGTGCAVGESPRMKDVERGHMEKVLALAGGRVTGRGVAAELLDMNPSTLRARMRKLGILPNCKLPSPPEQRAG